MSADPRATHWAQLGETTFVVGIWLLFWLHRLTGRWVFRAFMWPVVVVHWLRRPSLRSASLQYLQHVQEQLAPWPRPPGWRQGLAHVGLFAETMLDKLLASAGRYPLQLVRSHGAEVVFGPAMQGRGGVIVTAHLGCLELCRAMAQGRPGFKLTVLVHTRHAQAFNRILQRLGPAPELQLIEVTEITVGTAMLLADKVAAGGFIAIAGDRIPVSRSKTVRIPFLGHEAAFPIGPYLLAGLLQCPLYFMGCIHEGKGYGMHFERLAEHVELPRAQRDQALADYARRYVRSLTALIALSPYDWFNFYSFWDPAHA